MKSWLVRIAFAAGLLGGGNLLGFDVASATTYIDNFTASPTTFGCGYFVSLEICGGYSVLSAPRVLNAGDRVTENISFASALSVPGSTAQDELYVGLPDIYSVGGVPGAGPDSATIQATLIGYSGPPNPIAEPYSYVSSYLNEYLGIAGFCCNYGVPNDGFSATGIDVTFVIGASDPNPIDITTYGFAAALPATPQLLANIQGGTPGHPAILPSGEIGQLSVDLAGEGTQEYYGFYWPEDGLFQATGSVADALASGSYGYQLFNANMSYFDGVTLDSSDGFTDTISADLVAGYYVIGFVANSPNDPLATLTFDTPVSGSPEPATWAMLLTGFFGIGAVLRTSRSRRIELRHAA